MSIAQQAAEVLVGAERALAALASDTAKEGHYDAATRLIELAREVNVLVAKSRSELEPSPNPSQNASPVLKGRI
jgi:hypothetical protein